MLELMRAKPFSWQLLTAKALPSGDVEKSSAHVEAQLSLDEAATAYLPSTTRSCCLDQRKSLSDPSLRTKPSSTTSVSSRTTLCWLDESPMEASDSSPSLGRQRWRRLVCCQSLRSRLCSLYRRLFSVIFLANLVALLISLKHVLSNSQLATTHVREELNGVLTAVSINLAVSIAIRNEHVINLLFRIFVTPVTPQTSLSIRRMFAKVYHFGGVHSGCGVAAVVWYGLYTAVLLYDFIDSFRTVPQKANISFAIATWLFMCSLLTAATPHVRAKLHDWFERSHRFLGWLILALFWAQTLSSCMFASRMDAWMALIHMPTFWTLVAMSGFVIYPWLRVRRVNVRCEVLSQHAIRMYVEETSDAVMQPCRVIAISHAPLKETHKFATIPNPNGQPGYSMVISRAGDWTAKIINNPPKAIWIKGAPVWGVLRVATMFDPVIIVATGSGIGPCLGLFYGFPEHNCRVVWQARAPLKTYGRGIVDSVIKADKNAVIVDTEKEGRKDMALLALSVYHESHAEAVIVISNTEGTYRVVRELETRGVPAYGPIWDS